MTIGAFSTKLSTFFLVPLYTSCLSTAEYGTSDLITVTVSLLMPVLTVSASEGILRFTLDKENDKSQVFTIAISLFLGGLLILLAFSSSILDLLNLNNYHAYFVIYYITFALSSILLQFVKGLEHIRRFVFSGIISSAVNIACNVLFLLNLKMGIDGYLLAMIIGNIVQIIYIIFSEKIWEYFNYPWKIDSLLFKRFLLYSIPLIPNSISWWISNSSDRYILSYFCGTAVLGVYSVAYKIPSIVSVISSVFTSAWQISAIENYDDEESCNFFQNVYHKYSTIYVIGCSLVILLIRVIARVLFANEFYNAWPYAIILTFGAVFQAMGGFLGVIYGAAMKTREIFTTTIVGAVLNIILNIALIPSLGAMGAAIATLFSYIVVWLMRVKSTRKFMPIKMKWGCILLSYTFVAVQCLVTILEPPLWYIISILLTLLIVMLNKQELIDIVKGVFLKFKNKAN